MSDSPEDDEEDSVLDPASQTRNKDSNLTDLSSAKSQETPVIIDLSNDSDDECTLSSVTMDASSKAKSASLSPNLASPTKCAPSSTKCPNPLISKGRALVGERVAKFFRDETPHFGSGTSTDVTDVSHM